jgi:DNA polymerase-1
MEKLLIVDGSNLLFQMFYGMPARIINHQGKAIQGTLGFVGALLKMIRMVSPTHVAVLFDGETHNPRTDLDPDYKGNRPDYSDMPEEETPFSQLPDIFAALDELGIRWAETRVCEFDDWAAGYALTGSAGMQVIIASQDSDFYQLISDSVTVLRYRGDQSTLCTPDWVREKLGIEPEQYACFKSLTGDGSDNIKGAHKVGPKTVAALLRQFGSLARILTDWEQIQKPSVRAAIRADAHRLERNYALIKLGPEAPLPFPMEQLRWQYSGQTTTEVLRAIGLRE